MSDDMACLHCGDCCKRMSPLGSPCPKLVEIKGYWLCGDYANRPAECRNHVNPGRFCPIGIDVLGLTNPDAVRQRIDRGWELCKTLKEARGDALLPNNVPSGWCWGGEKGKCAWLDIGLDGGWPDAEHKCTCPDRCCEGSWFKEDTPHA